MFWTQLRIFIPGVLSLFIVSACSTIMMPPLPEEGGLGLFGDDSSALFEGASDGRITVIVDVSDQGFLLARGAQLKNLLSSKIIGDLNEVGVDDLNRKTEKKLIEELRLVVANGGSYGGSVVADYAVLATLIETRYGVSYKKPIKIPFTDQEEYKKKAGTCEYDVTVHIGLKIMDLSASARTVKSINVKETKKNSLNTTNQRCPVPQIEQHTLARIATESAVNCLTLPLQEFLAPRGRVIESRRDEKGRTFFRITTGKEGGIKVGDTVKIYSVSLLDKQIRADEQVTEGQVHKEIGANYAWVIVKDEVGAALIKKGDLAKVSYESKLGQSSDWVMCRAIRTES